MAGKAVEAIASSLLVTGSSPIREAGTRGIRVSPSLFIIIISGIIIIIVIIFIIFKIIIIININK